MRLPRIFVSSSIAGQHFAEAIRGNLDHSSEPLVWKLGFRLCQETARELVEISKTSDFAVFVFTNVDLTRFSEGAIRVMRNNVAFQLGLFVGALGKDRCFIVKPRDREMMMATDFLDLTPADYNGRRSDGNIDAIVNHSCTIIRQQVKKLGLFSSAAPVEQRPRPKVVYNHEMGDAEIILLAALLSHSMEDPKGTRLWSLNSNSLSMDNELKSIVLTKLEQSGYASKCIDEDGYSESYFYKITIEGTNFLLAHQKELHAALDRAPRFSDNYDLPF